MSKIKVLFFEDLVKHIGGESEFKGKTSEEIWNMLTDAEEALSEKFLKKGCNEVIRVCGTCIQDYADSMGIN